MKHFDFALETKKLDDDGAIEGIAAGYGNIDFGGDVILPGALTKSIATRPSVPMLLFHDQKRPVGVWHNFSESSAGLMAKGRFAMSTRAGKEAHALTKDGALGGLSIGYLPVRHKMTNVARELHEISLHEVSLVTIPMNERSVITSVKEILDGGALPTVREFEEHLRDAGFSKSLAAAIAGKAAPHLRGEPDDAKANEAAEFLKAMLKTG